ncbi:hypothetical protein P3W24_06815 [Luteibacter sp. PPL201]|uniref:Uncharacterized protein n=1 Tax=Luteibacter sahnii TaxID=3021977 RepID=A0ABT6B966_9GAMM
MKSCSVATCFIAFGASFASLGAYAKQPAGSQTHATIQSIVHELAEKDFQVGDVAAYLSAETGASFRPGTHGTSPVRVAGPLRLRDGTALDSIELTGTSGNTSRVVLSLPVAPCVDAKELARDLQVTEVGSGGLPSPAPMGSPMPERTFYTGDYHGSVGGHALQIGFKHWIPGDALCVSSISIEQ